jgi:hypothetical protein
MSQLPDSTGREGTENVGNPPHMVFRRQLIVRIAAIEARRFSSRDSPPRCSCLPLGQLDINMLVDE